MASQKATTITRSTPVADWPQFLRVEELAALTDTSKGVIYDQIRKGEIRAVSFGRFKRIPHSEPLRLAGVSPNGNGHA